jgi:retinol-binding protein 3
MRSWLFGILALISLHAALAAQQGKDEPTLAVTPEDRSKVITAIAKEFEERYVFPDVAAKVKEALEQEIEKGRYASISTGQELAKKLTQHLQELTKDKHVRVNCSTEKLPERKGTGGPSAEDMKQMRERMRLANAAFTKVERLGGNIGYIRLDGFMDPEAGREPLLAAMTFVKNTDALILDLRYNGGGTPLMIRDLCSYFFSGDKPVHLNSMFFRRGNRKEEFWTNKDVPGPRYLDKPVYVLTSAFTFSGGEECAYNFQTQKRGTLVGETTGGGAHPGGNIPVADHYTIFIPNGRAINPITNTNWEGVGVKPDVPVNADKALDVARELAVKTLSESNDNNVRERVKADLEREARSKVRIEERRQETLKSRQATKQ